RHLNPDILQLFDDGECQQTYVDRLAFTTFGVSRYRTGPLVQPQIASIRPRTFATIAARALDRQCSIILTTVLPPTSVGTSKRAPPAWSADMANSRRSTRASRAAFRCASCAALAVDSSSRIHASRQQRSRATSIPGLSS